MLKLMYITNQPAVAEIAQANGVDRLFLDLETLGKDQRQGTMDSVKSHHTFDDIRTIRRTIDRSRGAQAELLVRINPLHEKALSGQPTGDPASYDSAYEIDQVIACGADIVMLPMWKTVEEVAAFLRLVNGRARTMLLLETKEADAALAQVLSLGGMDEIHIGLNDLHLSYGKKFMFEMLTDGTVERLCRQIAAKGLFYGFGGIARIGQGTVPASCILGEHYRLGSGMVILSRSFCNAEKEPSLSAIDEVFRTGVRELRDFEAQCAAWDAATFEANRQMLCEKVSAVVSA